MISFVDKRVNYFDVLVGEVTIGCFYLLRLLVVLERLAFASYMLNFLVMNVVDLDNIVYQVVMIVVVLNNDTLCVPVVTIDIGNNCLLVLMVNNIFFDHRLHRVEIERDGTCDCLLRMSDILYRARCNGGFNVARVVWWWKDEGTNVQKRRLLGFEVIKR